MKRAPAPLTDPLACVEDLKLVLATSLRLRIIALGCSQQAAAEQIGISRSEVSRIMNGRVERFTIDRLVMVMASCGYRVVLEVR